MNSENFVAANGEQRIIKKYPKMCIRDRTQHQVALTLDDGPDPQVTPRVLDLLDTGAAKASFFCIGRRARQHPALCRELSLIHI